MQLHKIAEEYVRICFELEKHIPGHVDAYFGPQALRDDAAARKKQPLNDIIQSIEASMQKLAPDSNNASQRRAGFLFRQLRALRMLAIVARGDTVPYLEEVAAIYDIHPLKTPETDYRKAIDDVAHLLPGGEPLTERLETFRKQFEIPNELVREICAEALEFTRERTKKLTQLPEHESFEMTLVTGKPWSGYNWFKGNAHSLIEINVDLPRRIDHVLHLMSHEGYPGHHTDISTKEQRLYKDQGFVEFSMHPLFSPQSVLAEGIAETAGEMIYSKDEAREYMRERIARKIGRPNLDFDLLSEISSKIEALRSVPSNASIMLFQENRSEADVFDYLREFGLMDEAFTRKRIEFLKAYRGYIFTYYYGYDLLKHYFQGKDARAEFTALLSEPAYPSLFEPPQK